MGPLGAFAIQTGAGLLTPSLLKLLGLDKGTQLPEIPDLTSPVWGRYRAAEETLAQDAKYRLNRMRDLLGPGQQGSGSVQPMTDVMRNEAHAKNQLVLGFEDSRRSAKNQEASLGYQRGIAQQQIDDQAFQNRIQGAMDLTGAGLAAWKEYKANQKKASDAQPIIPDPGQYGPDYGPPEPTGMPTFGDGEVESLYDSLMADPDYYKNLIYG